MKILFISITFFLLTNCSKPKTVLICGDHVCLNKAEANQYFEENLSIEVKIINKYKKSEDFDLVELNLKKSEIGDKKVNIFSKKDTNQTVKTLSKEEIKKIKEGLKKKKNKNKIARKLSKKNKSLKIKENANNNIQNRTQNFKIKKNDVYKKANIIDVCSVLEKCSIEEISKYLLEQGKKKGFPDITKR